MIMFHGVPGFVCVHGLRIMLEPLNSNCNLSTTSSLQSNWVFETSNVFNAGKCLRSKLFPCVSIRKFKSFLDISKWFKCEWFFKKLKENSVKLVSLRFNARRFWNCSRVVESNLPRLFCEISIFDADGPSSRNMSFTSSNAFGPATKFCIFLKQVSEWLHISKAYILTILK